MSGIILGFAFGFVFMLWLIQRRYIEHLEVTNKILVNLSRGNTLIWERIDSALIYHGLGLQQEYESMVMEAYSMMKTQLENERKSMKPFGVKKA